MPKRQNKTSGLPQSGFVFDPKNHLYLLDGRPLTGVTTILSVIAKPALIQWAADETAKFLGWYDDRYTPEDGKDYANTFLQAQLNQIKSMSPEVFKQMLADARVQHAKRKKGAGDIGTEAHRQIEEYVKTGFWQPGSIEQINKMVSNFITWSQTNKVEFLESEKRLYSQKHWYAGTMDLVMKINGKIFIGDVKTGSSIYPEHFLQTAGYQLALQEMGEYPEIAGHVILNIKKNGEFEFREYYNYEQNREAFLAALTLYRAMENMKP